MSLIDVSTAGPERYKISVDPVGFPSVEGFRKEAKMDTHFSGKPEMHVLPYPDTHRWQNFMALRFKFSAFPATGW